MTSKNLEKLSFKKLRSRFGLGFFIFSIGSTTFADTAPRYSKKFVKQSVHSIEFKNLCTGEVTKIPANVHLELWSSNCGNCLQKIEDKKFVKGAIFISIDEAKEDQAAACELAKTYKINSLVDSSQGFQKMIGEGYPIPAALTVKKNKITKATFGYWRTSN